MNSYGVLCVCWECKMQHSPVICEICHVSKGRLWQGWLQWHYFVVRSTYWNLSSDYFTFDMILQTGCWPRAPFLFLNAFKMTQNSHNNRILADLGPEMLLQVIDDACRNYLLHCKVKHEYAMALYNEPGLVSQVDTLESLSKMSITLI